ncbi:MAG TPA: glutathione-disulfide reductase [Gammaproteobacteria bacterium]|nr:glutathione-disulfide reductase [Gammaproteobacteria bacterium]
MQKQFNYLVIGGGSGGIASARRAAEHGASVALIESGAIGGTCVNVGCVPKKIMWNTAHLATQIEDAKYYGFVLENKGLDWKILQQRRDAHIQRLHKIYDHMLVDSGVHFFAGRGQFCGPHRVQLDTVVLEAEHILIATGGKPLLPALPGAELGLTSDGFFAMRTLPQRVAIIGSGYIAVELAGVLNHLGSDVSLLLRKQQILRTFDQTLRDVLTDSMREDGIHIHNLFQTTALYRDTNKGLTVEQNNGENKQGFDQVIWAIGRKPNTAHLALTKCGLSTDTHGFIVTDEYQNTAVKGIYAVGDVTGRAALTPVAIAAGRQLAERLFNQQPEARINYNCIPTVVFSHPPIGTVGLTESQAIERYGEAQIHTYQSRFVNLYYAMTPQKPVTVVKLITVGEEETVVGCHLIGEACDEIIQGFAVAINMGARKQDLDQTIAIHPTAGEELVTLR